MWCSPYKCVVHALYTSLRTLLLSLCSRKGCVQGCPSLSSRFPHSPALRTSASLPRGVYVLFHLCALTARAEPTDLQEFSNKYSLQERQAKARAGIDVIANRQTSNGEFQDVGYWGSAATVYSAMANYDKFVSSTTYKSTVVNGINKVFGQYAHFDPVSTTFWFFAVI